MTFHFIAMWIRLISGACAMCAVSVAVYFGALVFRWYKEKNVSNAPRRICNSWTLSCLFSLIAGLIFVRLLYKDFHSARLEGSNLVLMYQWPRTPRVIPYGSIEKIEIQHFKQNRSWAVFFLRSESVKSPTVFDPALVEDFVRAVEKQRDAAQQRRQ